MKISSFATAVGLAVGYAAAQEEVVRTCDAPEPGSQLQAVLEDAAQPEPLDPNAPNRILDGINVDTYVHIVTNEADAGNFPPAMVDEQIRVMNDRYGPTGFTFNVQNITRTVSAAWGNGVRQGSQVELDMKRALNQGGYDALNIYFLGRTFMGNLGWCYFPQLQPNAIQRDIDGCINVAGSMPNGGTTNYEMGLTAVHEIGHWIGLFHVFQGGANQCAGGPGDFVDDTAPQRNATRGCPAVAPDSCPEKPGLDNIHNYMDYSFDTCMTEFTPGQVERGTNIYTSLRAGNVRFSQPASLGNAAIEAPRANCAGDYTYMQVRTWPGTEFNVDRCAEHCRETSRYNARHGLPGTCRFFNTYQQTRNGTVEFQACSLYTQAWGADRARNRGQWQDQGRTWVGIQNSVSAFDLDNDGTPAC